MAGLFIGTMSIIDVPDAKQLSVFIHKRFIANTPYTKEKETIAQGETDNPIPKRLAILHP